MANAMYLAFGGGMIGGTVELPASRGVMFAGYGVILEQQLKPDDAVGSMTLKLNNVVPGSTYDIEVLATSALAIPSGSAGSSTMTLAIPVYATGSYLNNLRIKFRKGSASPYYQPYETQIVAAVGAQTIFINQLTDE